MKLQEELGVLLSLAEQIHERFDGGRQPPHFHKSLVKQTQKKMDDFHLLMTRLLSNGPIFHSEAFLKYLLSAHCMAVLS